MKICVWPDGFWCVDESIGQYHYRSKDYEIVSVPSSVVNGSEGSISKWVWARREPEHFLCQDCGLEFSTGEVSGDPREYGCPECGSLMLDDEVKQ